jgi:phosphotransferase system HPr-like phosphotransfer protein
VAPLNPSRAGATADREIGEGRFVELLSAEAAPLFAVLAGLRSTAREQLGRAQFARLLHECHELESFLDDHGARLNRRFATFTELVASMRSFAITGYAMAHLRSRLASYGREAWGSAGVVVDSGTENGWGFVLASVDRLASGMEREAVELGVPDALTGAPAELDGGSVRFRLPHDIGEDQDGDDPQRVAELVSRYLQAEEMLADLDVRPIADAEVRRDYVGRSCREEQARVYEATVHNLQSTYDTHIKNTSLEASDRRLPAIRGRASAALHLLEGVTQLAHFHERHESKVGSTRAAALLAELVDPDRVQEVLVNDLLVAAASLLAEGRAVAEALLGDYTRVRELEVELPPGVSLHARPVALIVGIVTHFGTPVEVEIGGRRCNAGSILEVLMAIGAAPDSSQFVFRGDERPLEHIALLFEHDLGEGEVFDLPNDLGYLRPK